jgi:hypothetical protein
VVLTSPSADDVCATDDSIVTGDTPPDDTTPRAPGRVGCSTVARRLGEPLAGTAPAGTTRWLLVEHPGPWPLQPAQLSPVLARAEAAGIRVQLIRRPARRRRVSPHQIYVVNTERPWVEGREIADLAELAALDVAAVAAGRRPGFGETVAGPVFLVCTHGRRDACCAEFGRPVAAAIARDHAAAWETTHLGGDRFAASAVCFPDGLYFGRLDPASGPEVAAAYARGEIVLPHFRGRAGTPDAVQAAEHHVRMHLDARGTADLATRDVTPDGACTAVVLDVRDRRFRVLVEHGESAVRRQLTCRATEATCAPVRRVVGLTEVAGETRPAVLAVAAT